MLIVDYANIPAHSLLAVWGVDKSVSQLRPMSTRFGVRVGTFVCLTHDPS